jgi:IMP dehydrogenase
MEIRQGLTFDDVLLVPRHSDVKTRSEIDTSCDLGKGVFLKIPIIPANMKSIIETDMAKAVANYGGLAIFHRFMEVNEQVAMFNEAKGHGHVGIAIGVKEEDRERLAKLVAAGCRVVCIDVAHGDSILCVEMVSYVHKQYPDVLLIAGNIATAEGAMRLVNAGADVIKVGIGPGSLCTTRIETGNGVPQLTALMDVFEAQKKSPKKFKIIADGGIKNSGDVVKALCFSDAVMMGNVFAGTDEAPGKVISVQGKPFKEYVGSSTHKASHVEGVTALVPYKGPVDRILTRLMEGVRSGCSYQGVQSTRALQLNPQFIKISHAGLTESHPHDVMW